MRNPARKEGKIERQEFLLMMNETKEFFWNSNNKKMGKLIVNLFVTLYIFVNIPFMGVSPERNYLCEPTFAEYYADILF